MKPQIDFFGVYINTYDILLSIGVLVMVWMVIYALEVKHKYEKTRVNQILVVLVLSLILAYVGAVLFDLIFHFIETGEFKLYGLTFFGGLFFGVIAFVVLSKFMLKEEKNNVLNLLNIFTLPLLIAHAIGRLGCFMAGCCYGVTTTSFLGVHFPHLEEGVKVLPTQLFEMVFLIGLFIVLKYIVKKKEFMIYAISYGAFRFLIEFLRGDDRGSFIIISPSQFLSIILIVFGIVLIILDKKKISF
ncbi:MAG: prolipoprotein diacylglyceryl transferase [Bacilli bacterium]|nr:prolipoprotein diacylglyceryl transferase [Bacilli bacterium]